MEIIRVVLTGGPCAGKTMALDSIKRHLSERNIKYITVSETATEFIKNGMLFNKKFVYEFQTLIYGEQLNKEKVPDMYANIFYKDEDKCVIIYDRALIDNKAYLSNYGDFTKISANFNLSEIDTLDKYDLVLDLLTVALCKPSAYNLSNEARKESLEEAIEIDYKTSLAWIGHRNLRIIDSSISIEEEQNLINNYIDELIDGLSTKEVRRFLVDDSNSNYSLYKSNNSETLYVTDYFLKGDNNKYHYLLSKREYKNNISYVYTEYYEENGKIKVVKDKKITIEEYMEILSKCEVIEKNERKEINFVYNRHKYKLCFYEGYTILEIEKNNLDDELVFPDNLKILNEIIEQNKKIKVRSLVNGNI